MMDKIGVFCSSSDNLPAHYYTLAAQLGEWMGRNGKTLVYGGCNCGLMEAVAKAVHTSGGKVFGVVPRILVERGRVSDYIDITFHCEDLTDRKQWLESESDVLIALPGSIGTLDEAFTVMAQCTIGVNDKKVIFWNIDGFWDGLFDMLRGLEDRGVVNKPLSQCMVKVDSLEELINNINICVR